MARIVKAIVRFADPDPSGNDERDIKTMLTYGTNHQDYDMSVVEILECYDAECRYSDDGQHKAKQCGWVIVCIECGAFLEEVEVDG